MGRDGVFFFLPIVSMLLLTRGTNDAKCLFDTIFIHLWLNRKPVPGKFGSKNGEPAFFLHELFLARLKRQGTQKLGRIRKAGSKH